MDIEYNILPRRVHSWLDMYMYRIMSVIHMCVCVYIRVVGAYVFEYIEEHTHDQTKKRVHATASAHARTFFAVLRAKNERIFLIYTQDARPSFNRARECVEILASRATDSYRRRAIY